MTEELKDLPDDVESLRRLVLAAMATIKSKALEIEHLKVQIARLRRMRFGRSSEKLDAKLAQLELAL